MTMDPKEVARKDDKRTQAIYQAALAQLKQAQAETSAAAPIVLLRRAA